MVSLKEKHGLNATKNIETTLPEEDKIRHVNDPDEKVNDPDEKGPFIN